MDWKRTLRIRRLRDVGPPPDMGKWSALRWRPQPKWERWLLFGMLLVLPATCMALAPVLTSGLREVPYEEYQVAIVEKVVKLHDDPPPPPPEELTKPETRPERSRKKPVERVKSEPEESPPEPDESDGDEKPDPAFGIDEGSTVDGSGSGFALSVGDSLMVDPDRPAAAKKAEPPPPPPAPPKPKVYSIKQVTTKPKVSKKVSPAYTDAALEKDVEGRVILEIVIGTDGKVSSVKVASGLGHGLDEACIEAVKQSRYEPATVNGKPVICKLKIPFKFELE